MKSTVLLLLVMIATQAFSQESLIPLHSFYKDQIFANKLDKPYNEGSFFPVSENSYNLIPAINDSTKQYYKVTHTLFQKYLFEIKGKDFYVKISPAIDFSYGKDLGDTLSRTLFQNTRGFHVEVNLFKKFSLSTSLYENQGRYTNYETAYYSSIGELYPKSDSTYLTQNGVYPGGGRTKGFKGDGFDYAYAVGYFVYRPFDWVRIMAGNNSQFIGDGHRSLLLSDNSYSAPYYRLDFKISPKFSFTYHRSRQMNLLRRPSTTSVESYYEPKGFSVNYFTYKPMESMSISLFESGSWSRGDSVTSKSSHWLYYNPIPFVSGLALKNKNEVVSLIGLNLSYQIAKAHRVYGQIAMNDYNGEKLAFQVGYRGYNYFGVGDFMLQVEYNNVAKGMYEADNRRLNYVHFNLPVAHVKGSGFQEFLLRTNFEYKRAYIEASAIYYITKEYNSVALLPVYRDLTLSSNQLFYTNIELGYRFNRKMNLSIFANWTYRTVNDANIATTNYVSAGIRTGFINHYRDF
ncbi:MAG: hypothetical protein QNK23_00840 [Crocinitomicaceae bacterium]|nr:hypothetical protein [Crocinitomicaceae bacterium]